MLFNFELRNIEHLSVWEDAQKKKESPSFCWFWLTEGYYWLGVGDDELFCYSNEILAHWEERGEVNTDKKDNQIYKHQRYFDYYVVRLWEDVLEFLPDVLEPIPSAVLNLLQPGASAAKWQSNIGDIYLPEDEEFNQESFQEYISLTSWVGARRLARDYLANGADIWFWNDGKEVFIHWDAREAMIEGIPVWKAHKGTFCLPLEQFYHELEDFNQRLMTKMEQRIEQFGHHCLKLGAACDLEYLREEHQSRQKEFSTSLEFAKNYNATNWDAILVALNEVSAF